MSNMNNNNNQMLPPPPPPPQQQQYNNNNNNNNRGGDYGGNQFNYRNRNGNFNGNFNRRNTYYNQNYRQQYNNNNNNNYRNNGYDNGGYGIVNRPWNPRYNQRYNQNRRQSHSGSREQQRRGPRNIRLNDFMPADLRDPSPSAASLPDDFNLRTTGSTTANTRPVTPVNALPQRPNFLNLTQPFNIDQNNPNQQQQRRQVDVPNNQQRSTASYRRRQRRNRQEQYRSNGQNNNNRFAAFQDQDNLTDMESNYGDDVNDPPPTANNKNKTKESKNKNKKKQRFYLEPNQIMRYMQDKSSTSVSGRGNQAYVLATTAIYDEWVRNNYELQVWQTYLKMGTENKHWAKEIVQRTKKRDNVDNTRFVQKKISRLTVEIAKASATISDLQIQLGTYWTQTAAAVTTTNTTTTANTSATRARDSVDRLEKSILKYVQHCTQHVKKMAENKIQLAKIQMEEFKALEDFEQIATPAQWNLHLVLKPKIKLWSTKNKNYRTAMKRVEYDLPPKFIEKIDLTFKVDESILSQEEVQGLYNQMRQLTKDFRTQAMTLYVQSCTREFELLTNEIKRITEGFPHENEDGFDTEAGNAAFKHYNDIREKRFNLEAEQSIYFLDEMRVEGEAKEAEEIIAPTLTRSLGEDFLLQQ